MKYLVPTFLMLLVLAAALPERYRWFAVAPIAVVGAVYLVALAVSPRQRA